MKNMRLFYLLLLSGLMCTVACKKKQTPFKPDGPTTKKPVIYLYPTKETEVKINLDYKGKLLATYPLYQNGWHISVSPDGKITLPNQPDRVYDYLFYEGNTTDPLFEQAYFKDGFCLPRNEVIPFLEEKLAFVGLNQREINDMVSYWIAELTEKEYVLFRLRQGQACNSTATLSVVPAPDTELRLMLDFLPLNSPHTLPAQPLYQVQREGFVLVEWGGVNLANLKHKLLR